MLINDYKYWYYQYINIYGMFNTLYACLKLNTNINII